MDEAAEAEPADIADGAMADADGVGSFDTERSTLHPLVIDAYATGLTRALTAKSSASPRKRLSLMAGAYVVFRRGPTWPLARGPPRLGALHLPALSVT